MSDHAASKRLLDPQEDVEYIFTNCCEQCCQRGRLGLSNEELTSLNMLRARARVQYVGEEEYHRAQLERLWRACFDEEPTESLVDEKWKRVGFQGTNPATDFRGTGLFGLQQLVYLATVYNQHMLNLLDSAEAYNYSLAISGINVTSYLMAFFQLNQPNKALMPDMRLAPARILKTFARLNYQYDEAIDEIYIYAVLQMNQI